jgi:hypothetical protein
MRLCPFFTARYNIQYDRHGVYEGHIIPMHIQEDLSVAGQYTWEHESWRVSRRLLLWRIAQSDDQSVIGASGSVICMGKHQDEEVSAR